MRDVLFSVGFIAFAALFGHQARALVTKPVKLTVASASKVVIP